MRVATWNVNGLRSRLEFVKIWLRERKPDLVALQELKLEDEKFPHDELEAEGYTAAVHGQKAWNGVAVLCRRPVEIVQRGLPGQEELGSRLLTIGLGELRFTSLYCPNGKSVDHQDFPRKLAWFESLADHLESASTAARPAVVCGDFNICPEGIDSWNEAGKKGKIFHTGEERRRFQSLLDLGFTDLYRSSHPDRQAFSWWDYRAGSFHKNRGLRIDFLLGSASLGEVTAVEIDREFRKKQDGLTPSDHAPVWADSV
ncbi:MAG: exodeoxyribonuclease III [Thermoanaerobaculia bacterium]